MNINNPILFQGSIIPHYRRNIKGRIISLSFSFKKNDIIYDFKTFLKNKLL
jgi:hypothetical protein